MKLSIIIPSLTGAVPRSLATQVAGVNDVELVIVKGVSPVSAARNEGLARAKGAYIAWVDADDEVAPNWLAAILGAINLSPAPNPQPPTPNHQPPTTNHQPPDIITFNARAIWMDGSGRASYTLDGRRTGQLWCKVFRRELFTGLRFEGTVHEDWRIQCQMPRNVRHRYIAAELYTYQRRARSLSQHPDAWSELKALWGLMRICNSWMMFRGICERTWDFLKTPVRRMRRWKRGS